MPHTISIVSAAGCTCIAEEVAVFASGTLKILSTLTRAIWQTNRWVVVISAGESRRTVAVVARLRIHTVWLLTNKSVRRAIKLVITRRGWLTNTVGAVRAIGTIARARAAVGRATRTFHAFTVSILTTRDRITVAVVDTSAQVVGVKAFVVGIAEPFTWTLLVEVTCCRRCAA